MELWFYEFWMIRSEAQCIILVSCDDMTARNIFSLLSWKMSFRILLAESKSLASDNDLVFSEAHLHLYQVLFYFHGPPEVG